MFSNKMTFSLVRVIVLFAFASLLVPPAVEAALTWNPATQSDLVRYKNTRVNWSLPRAEGAAGVTYSISPNLPTGLRLITSSVSPPIITGTVRVGSPTTAYTLTAAAPGETSITLTFNMRVNSSPVLSGGITSPQTATVGTVFSLVLPAATQEDGDTTTYTLTRRNLVPLPAGLTFTASTRTLAGTPTEATPGVELIYTAADAGQTGIGSTPRVLFTLVIIDPSAVPNPVVPIPPQTPPSAPSAPTGVVATAGVGKVTVTWTGGSNSGFEYSRDGGAWASVSAYPLELTGPAGTPISVRIRVAAAGNTPAGTPSAAATGTPTGTTLPAPSAPTGVVATAGVGKITVTWTGGSTSGFDYSQDNGAWASVSVYPLELTGPAGTPISVRIRVAAAGNTPAGTASTAATGTPTGTTLPAPSAPTGVVATPGDGMITVRWTEGRASTVSQYEHSTDGGANWVSVPAYPLVIRGPNDTPITVQLRKKAIDDVMPAGRVATVTGTPIAPTTTGTGGGEMPTQTPAAPTGVRATAGVDKVTVTWDNGSTTGFDYSRNGGAWTSVSGYPLELTGPANTPISVRIRVALSGNTPAGTPSTPVSGTPTPPPVTPTPPAAPTSVTATPDADKTVPTQTVLINEIGNSGTDAYDWVELLNTTDTEVNLRKWVLNIVMADAEGNPTEKQLVSFPNDNDTQIPANGILLLTHSDPTGSGNDLAAGVDITKAVADRVKRGVSSYYYIDSKLLLPNDNQKYNFILRNASDKEGKSMNIVDHGGTYFGEKEGDGFDTEVWPLQATLAGHGNVIAGSDDEDFRVGFVYKRAGKNSGIGEKHWAKVGFTGVGYDRMAATSDENGGTPGYANDALKEKVADLASDAEMSISEIMVDVGSGSRSLPQWIELYNASMTQAVNLNGWKLEFQNTRHEELDARVNATITLGAVTLAPNQTVLLVSRSGLNSGRDHFPETRTIDLWTDHRDALGMTARSDTVLSAAGFYLKLTDKDNKRVDEAGNTDGDRSANDPPAWALPGGMKGDGGRVSMIRRYKAGIAEDGMMASGWLSASQTKLSAAGFRERVYYGAKGDLGTPGFHGGGPLPVSLSGFHPVRDAATGEVVIRWSTESEVNNAGFNILRSETKTGAFKVVNVKGMIIGHGTTAEKHTYEWTDATAKPDVLYYYQIEDVSLDGKRTTLRTTHLRGNVTAAGKATTTWGQLKSQQ